MNAQQLLAQLKLQTQAGRYAHLQKAANTKLVRQAPAQGQSRG